MHCNPLKRAKPIRSSAATTPGANLPRLLARSSDRDCSMGKHGEQAWQATDSAGHDLLGCSALRRRRGSSSGSERAIGSTPGPSPPSPAACRLQSSCTAASGVFLHLALQSASHSHHGPTITAYTRARATYLCDHLACSSEPIANVMLASPGDTVPTCRRRISE